MSIKRDKVLGIRVTEKEKASIEKFKLQLSYELDRNITLADMFLFLIKEYNNKEK